MMRWPLNSVSVTQEFGSTAIDYSQFGLKGHHGIDLLANTPIPVYAPESGTILQSANGVTDPKSGRFAAGETIVMSGKYEHWLMHLSKREVKAGDTVKEGQLLGYTGNTGFTTGPHLHWGTRPLNPDMNNGYRGFINPRNVISTPSAGGKIMDTDAKVAAQYNTLRGNTGTPAERKAWIGQSYEKFNATAVPEVNARQANLANLQKQVASQNASIAALNTKVTALTNQVNTLTAQVKTLTATVVAKDKEIADLKAQVAAGGTNEDSINLNKLGEALRWVIARLGLK